MCPYVQILWFHKHGNLVKFYCASSLLRGGTKYDLLINVYSAWLRIFWLRKDTAFFSQLHWVFVGAHGLSLVAANGGFSSLQCAGISLWWLILLWSTDCRHVGSVAVAHRFSYSKPCEIFSDRGSNQCPLHWQAKSHPLCHQVFWFFF